MLVQIFPIVQAVQTVFGLNAFQDALNVLNYLNVLNPGHHFPVMIRSSLPGSYGRVSRARSIFLSTSSGACASFGKSYGGMGLVASKMSFVSIGPFSIRL